MPLLVHRWLASELADLMDLASLDQLASGSAGQQVSLRGISRPHPHMLRHTFVTTVLDVDLRDVRVVARHAVSSTTMRYDRARKNLDRHPTTSSPPICPRNLSKPASPEAQAPGGAGHCGIASVQSAHAYA